MRQVFSSGNPIPELTTKPVAAHLGVRRHKVCAYQEREQDTNTVGWVATIFKSCGVVKIKYMRPYGRLPQRIKDDW